MEQTLSDAEAGRDEGKDSESTDDKAAATAKLHAAAVERISELVQSFSTTMLDRGAGAKSSDHLRKPVRGGGHGFGQHRATNHPQHL